MSFQCEHIGDNCQKSALFRAYWPGRTIHLCEKHLSMASGAAAALGLRLDYVPWCPVCWRPVSLLHLMQAHTEPEGETTQWRTGK